MAAARYRQELRHSLQNAEHHRLENRHPSSGRLATQATLSGCSVPRLWPPREPSLVVSVATSLLVWLSAMPDYGIPWPVSGPWPEFLAPSRSVMLPLREGSLTMPAPASGTKRDPREAGPSISAAEASGRSAGTSASAGSVTSAAKTVHGTKTEAERQGLVPRNVARLVHVPSGPRFEAQPLTSAQAEDVSPGDRRSPPRTPVSDSDDDGDAPGRNPRSAVGRRRSRGGDAHRPAQPDALRGCLSPGGAENETEPPHAAPAPRPWWPPCGRTATVSASNA